MKMIHGFVLQRAPSVPLLDTRTDEAYGAIHLVGSSHIPAASLSERASELPPKGSALFCIVNGEQATFVESELARLGYCCKQMIVSNDELWSNVSAMPLVVERGPTAVRMWKPSQFLADWIDVIENRVIYHPASASPRTAIDLGCGSGRDAMFLAERGWRVTAIDNLQPLLDRCAELCKQANLESPPTLLCWDIEAMHRERPLHERFGVNSFDVIHVSRYLHRPLYDSLRLMVRPHGFIVFSTFMRGCEELGKPRKPQYILEVDELKATFGPSHGFLVYEYCEKRLDDYRPLQHICAQKLSDDEVREIMSRGAHNSVAAKQAAAAAAAAASSTSPATAKAQ
jgi:tellurite methyltransferase